MCYLHHDLVAQAGSAAFPRQRICSSMTAAVYCTRHIPAAKIHHPPAKLAMNSIQRSLL